MPWYGTKLSDNMIKTPEGFLICKNVIIGIEGPLEYLDSELGIGNQGSIIEVMRGREANYDKETIASFEGKPITDGHPQDDVDPTNSHFLSKGHLQNVHSATLDNGKSCIMADLMITDESLINDILDGSKREVSCGYDTEYELRNDILYQKNIRGNHLAIIDKGRAGPIASIRDSLPCNQLKGVIMKKVKNTLDEFQAKITKVKTLDEANALIEEMSEKLSDPPVEEIKQDHLPGPDGKLVPNQEEANFKNAIMEAINALAQKVDALMAKGEPSPEEDIDKAIATLGNEESSSKDEAPGMPNKKTPDFEIDENKRASSSDEAEEVPQDTIEVSGGSTNDEDKEENDYKIEEVDYSQATRDGAMQMLKSFRKAIAEITDPTERRRVTDCMLEAAKKLKVNNYKSNTSISDVLSVQKNRVADSKSNYEEENKKISNAYASMNPHMARKLNLK